VSTNPEAPRYAVSSSLFVTSVHLSPILEHTHPVIDKTPTHALFIQHCINLACWFH